MTTTRRTPPDPTPVSTTTTWLSIVIGIAIAGIVLAISGEQAELYRPRLRLVPPAALVIGGLSGWAMPRLVALVRIPGVAPMAVVSTLVATYLCVPETDQFPVAAIAPVVLVAVEVVLRRQVPLLFYAVAAMSIAWAGMYGADGRPSAFVGALFAWWAVMMAPLVALVQPMPNARVATVVAGIGSIAAVVAARTGGIAESAEAAVTAVVVVAIVSAGIGYVVARFPPTLVTKGGVSATPPLPPR